MRRHKLIKTGLEYCTTHNGVADVDQECCDFYRLNDDPLPCNLYALVYDKKAPSRLIAGGQA